MVAEVLLKPFQLMQIPNYCLVGCYDSMMIPLYLRLLALKYQFVIRSTLTQNNYLLLFLFIIDILSHKLKIIIIKAIKQMHIFLPKVMNQQFSIIIIIFFEFFGTMLFGYINLTILNAKATSQSNQDLLLIFVLDYALSLFVCASFGRQFSGGVYNPAIILYRQLRKTDRLTLKIGLAYQISQYLGGSIGSLIAVYVNDFNHAPIMKILDQNQQIRQFFTQVIGTFILALLGQMLIEKKMTFIQHNRQFYIAVPLIFMTTRGYCQTSNGVNPGLGFGFEFAYACKTGNWEVFSMVYILTIGPYVGAIVAVLFFQYVLKPLYPFKKQQIQQILQQVLAQNQKKMREMVQITQQQILQYRQNYCQQALKLGVQLQSLKPSQGVSSSLFPIKVINHRWSLSQTLTQEPMYAPINFKHFQVQNGLSIIGQEYLDQDIQSIQQQQQQKSFLSNSKSNKFKQKLLNLSFNKHLNTSMNKIKNDNLNNSMNRSKIQINQQFKQKVINNFNEQFSMLEQSFYKQQSHQSQSVRPAYQQDESFQDQPSQDRSHHEGDNQINNMTYEQIRKKFQEEIYREENQLQEDGQEQQSSQQDNNQPNKYIIQKLKKNQQNNGL